MGERTTFFTVDRRLLESDMWLEEPFDKARAWIDLIGRASYADTDLCARGQLVTSERALATRWKWTRSKVRCFLIKLEADGRIKRQPNLHTSEQPRQPTTITIENYDKYQLQQPTKQPRQQPKEQPYKNNINNLNNLSNMPVGMAEEIKAKFGDRAEALIEDVRRYYESHPDKEFPGWVQAVTQFSANQARWGKRKKQRTMEELMKEALNDK